MSTFHLDHLNFTDFDPKNTEHIDWIAALWNTAVAESMPISSGFVHFNTQPTTGGIQSSRIALDADDRPVGFVLASAHPSAPPSMSAQGGWIDAIAVAPHAQRQGIGASLLAWAEAWLAAQECTQIRIGASLRPFAPGVPIELGTVDFFTAHGYAPQGSGIVWDVARNLADYTPPPGLDNLPCAVRPAQPNDKVALLSFLQREFPGRWTFEFLEILANGGRISDYMILWTEDGVDGACRLTFEDSVWPIERFYPYHLPRPWGQLGSIGISAAKRGRNFGLALLDAGLRRLHNNGVNGCVIDWTTLLDFYAKCGFEPYRSYQQLGKGIGE
ncbi:GNAT family N-acetyltransferase [bacterium]|nr:GNAT family N-acetyltransferase [bacterium]